MQGGGLLRGMKPDAPPGTGEGFAVALCVLAICILTTVASAKIAGLPYQPPPLKVAVKSDKDEARVPPSYRPVPVEVFTKAAALHAELVTMPWTCGVVRQAVRQYGRETVKQYARAKGYTKKQIEEAMACLTEKKT